MKYSILTQHELGKKNKIKHNSSRESGPSCLSVCKSLSLADQKKKETLRQEVELKEAGLTGKWGSVIWPLILTLRCISRWSCFFVPSLYGGIPSLWKKKELSHIYKGNSLNVSSTHRVVVMFQQSTAANNHAGHRTFTPTVGALASLGNLCGEEPSGGRSLLK